MRKKIGELTTKERQNGIKRMEEWYKNHPNKNDYVILSGDPRKCWTPTQIIEEIRKRDKSGEWGKDDFPEAMIAIEAENM